MVGTLAVGMQMLESAGGPMIVLPDMPRMAKPTLVAALPSLGLCLLITMLSLTRDPAADHKRQDAMATAAGAYLHPKFTWCKQS